MYTVRESAWLAVELKEYSMCRNGRCMHGATTQQRRSSGSVRAWYEVEVGLHSTLTKM